MHGPTVGALHRSPRVSKCHGRLTEQTCADFAQHFVSFMRKIHAFFLLLKQFVHVFPNCMCAFKVLTHFLGNILINELLTLQKTNI